jgi:hypothetical protein
MANSIRNRAVTLARGITALYPHSPSEALYTANQFVNVAKGLKGLGNATNVAIATEAHRIVTAWADTVDAPKGTRR